LNCRIIMRFEAFYYYFLILENWNQKKCQIYENILCKIRQVT